jgi:AcrR family transcriptional regulator
MTAPNRRMGSVDSAMGEALLKATEEVLRDEGYAALTSRRVAEYAGVKQRLVYYYFATMDDLVIETFRRLALRDLARLKRAISSDHPLHDIWEVCMNTTDSRLVAEFMALAYRHEGLRLEVIKFIEESRDIQVSAIKKALAKGALNKDLKPVAIALLASSVALSVNREAAIGVTKGHQTIKKLIKQFCDSLDC